MRSRRSVDMNRIPARIRPYLVSRTAREAKEQRLTYLSWQSLRNLERALKKASKVPGDFLEAGVALGGSSVLIAKRMPAGRTFHGYDVFGQIPPPSERDDEKSWERYQAIADGRSKGIGGDSYYGYENGLFDKVKRTFESFGLNGEVQLHQGDFGDTLHPTGPVAFAHIDCDWYAPVKLSMDRIYPHLSPGGTIVLDDYFCYGGAKEAVDEFLGAHRDLRRLDLPETNLVLQRS